MGELPHLFLGGLEAMSELVCLFLGGLGALVGHPALVLGDLDELASLQGLLVRLLREQLRLPCPVLGGLHPSLGLRDLLRRSLFGLFELLCLLVRFLQTLEGLSGLVLRRLRADLRLPDPVRSRLAVALCGLDQPGGLPDLLLGGLCSLLGLAGPLDRIPARASACLVALPLLAKSRSAARFSSLAACETAAPAGTVGAAVFRRSRSRSCRPWSSLSIRGRLSLVRLGLQLLDTERGLLGPGLELLAPLSHQLLGPQFLLDQVFVRLVPPPDRLHRLGVGLTGLGIRLTGLGVGLTGVGIGLEIPICLRLTVGSSSWRPKTSS